jgi:Zn-dependent protease
MSLNPVRHIDPFGTVLIPLALALLSSPFIFGYAKPVPVDFSRLRNPKKQMAWVALAGPMANLVMAFLWMLSYVLLQSAGIGEVFFIEVAKAGVKINLILFAFNLFPLPPLDGGRIMTSILPNRYAFRFSRLEPYGFFIVLGLMMLNLLTYWMVPVMALAALLLKMLMSPIQSLLI